MIKVTFIFTLLFSHYLANSQYILFLSNGESLEYKSYKIKDNIISIKTKSGTVTFPGDIKSIVGYLNIAEDKFYYIKKIGDSYADLERVEDGNINIYEDMISKAGPYVNGQTTRYVEYFWFFEKDEQITKLKSLSRDETKEYLMSLFADCPDIIKELNNETIELFFTDKEKIRLAKKYNLLMFSKPKSYSTNSSAFFYSKIKRGENEALKLKVNDSTEYLIPANRSISVGLSTEDIFKICVSFDQVEECIIMRGSPFQIKYYEVVFNPVSGKLDIDVVKSTDAQKYLQYALKNKINN